jgi:hypothetical protein
LHFVKDISGTHIFTERQIIFVSLSTFLLDGTK